MLRGPLIRGPASSTADDAQVVVGDVRARRHGAGVDGRDGRVADYTSHITSVITLGGHHLIVLGIAMAGFLLLAVLAAVTRGFAVASSVQYTAIAVAGVLSVVALAGVMSVVGLVVGAILLAARLFRARLRSDRRHPPGALIRRV